MEGLVMLNVRRGALARAIAVTGLFSVVAVVSSQPVAAAAGDKVRLVDIPLAEMILNPCTNEMVTIVGSTNLTLYTKVQKNGALDVTLRIASKGDGTAQSAYGGGLVPYRFHSVETTRTRDVPSGAFELAALAKTMLIRKGELGE